MDVPRRLWHAAMKPAIRARYQVRAKILKALAHPARLLIVDELAKTGDRCVCELTVLVGSDMSTVSRHLAVLKNAGIVEDERRGQKVFFRLRVPCVMNFFACVEDVIRYNLRDRARLLD